MIVGTPLPNNESSSGCALCFGVGKPFSGEQPRYADVVIRNCIPMPGSNFPDADLGNGSYRVQHVSDCFYLLQFGDKVVRFDWDAFQTTGEFFSGFGVPTTFVTGANETCRTVIPGLGSSDPNKVSIFGEMLISWSQDGL